MGLCGWPGWRASALQARPRYLGHDNTAEPLDGEQAARLLGEAYQCATLAATYIDKAATGLLDPGADTPF